jgi:hypothetical protein
MDVHYAHSSTNSNGNQQLGGNKKKVHGNNCRGGKTSNKPKDNSNNEKLNNNVDEGKKEGNKVKFPCNICIGNHLTHLLFVRLHIRLRSVMSRNHKYKG